MDIFSTENLTFTPTASSPRISFSHNLDNSLIESSYPYRSNSSPDFDFCFTSDPIENQASSADELFSNGQIRRYNSEENILIPPLKERSKEIVSNEGRHSKSFWRIKRSSSLHCESTKQKSSFWSSLPLLSRSNSTGSVMKDNRQNNKQNPSQKQSNYKNSSSSMKPPLKRRYGGGYDYGVGVSPVLNVPVPPPFISRNAANILGLGSFFGHCSDQKTKK